MLKKSVDEKRKLEITSEKLIKRLKLYDSRCKSLE
jgi:hypothetical protein